MPRLLPEYQPRFAPADLELIHTALSRRNTPHAVVVRAKLALLLHENPAMSSPQAARILGVHEQFVRKWRRRWCTEGFSLQDRPRSGRPPKFFPPRPGEDHRTGL